MCDVHIIEFFINNIQSEEIFNKRVLEVGSKYVNGSVRPLIENFLSPREYIGIDMEPGRYVDVVLPAEDLINHFGEESFDVLIATEFIEHVKDWRQIIDRLKKVLKPGAHIYITTCSQGFPFHGYPYDFWRYELSDLEKIFSDFELITLEQEQKRHSVFLKAIKPLNWKKIDTSNISLYSMILGKRTESIPEIYDIPIYRKSILKFLTSAKPLFANLFDKYTR